MKKELKFFRCEICGNMVEMIHKGGGTMVCCGQNMTELVPNTVDAVQEKHVPVAVKEENKLTVTVGSVLHPMTPEHHIEWIAIAQGERVQRAALDPEGSPEAEFYVEDGPITLYEYCNLHGLWKSDF